MEIGLPSRRVENFDEETNDEKLRTNLDLATEVRKDAEVKLAKYKAKVVEYYNRRVYPRQAQVGDLVLRKAAITERDTSRGKLTPNWEGPYKVIEELAPGTYKLQQMDGKILSHTWNMENLKVYYQ